MRRAVLPGVVAALVATATPAGAHPAYHYAGGCGFGALSDGTDDASTAWRGSLYAAVVATDAGRPAPVPIGVECRLYVDGAQWQVLAASGTGTAADAEPLEFHAPPAAGTYVCAVVTVAGERHESCPDGGVYGLVPQPAWALVDEVLALLDPYQTGEPWLCPFLGRRSPGVPGVVDVLPEGDVYVAGEFVFDCPPYAS